MNGTIPLIPIFHGELIVRSKIYLHSILYYIMRMIYNVYVKSKFCLTGVVRWFNLVKIILDVQLEK